MERVRFRFLRISSEIHPFASYAKYNYPLDFAKKNPFGQAGRLAMGYGRWLMTHAGQFTRVGNTRKEVVEVSTSDLGYQSQLLSLLGLKGQEDSDTVMIPHMGELFEARKTLSPFWKIYFKLSDNVKAILVLENDGVVTWTVHDLLPICQALNIRHSERGTWTFCPLPSNKEVMTRKRITQKQHY
ncbi:unnamed protein product [Tuber aestivum]|uniref:Uncharacterized protein n=1 Tax=Tuber aestivum TaxID=59557 RepID=A0A292Q3R0_9PEZI|nr:unnamed protein product [Tuber aestivum]